MTLSLVGLTAVLAVLYLLHARFGARLDAYLRGGLRRLDPSHTVRSGLAADEALDHDLLADRLARRRTAWSGHRATLWHFGLVLALGLVTLAFEYRSTGRIAAELSPPELAPEVEIEVVRTPAERPPQPPPPPPAPAERFDLRDLLELVPDEVALPEPEPLPESEPARGEVELAAAAAVPAPPKPTPPPPSPAADIEETFVRVEDMPRFPGCEDMPRGPERDACAERLMLADVMGRFRVPAVARENGVEGTAVVSFVVERDGRLTELEVLRDPGGGIGREALRVVAGMPRWIPGMQRGRPVRVKFTLPVRVRLE